MRLYEIANDYVALMQAIENDEIPEECIADTLEAIKGEIEIKADNIACLLKNTEAEIRAFKEEENRLAERRKVKEKALDHLKTYLSDMLIRTNVRNIETVRNKIGFRKSEIVEVDDAKFLRWAIENRNDLLSFKEPTANKTEIKKALKGGQAIEGAKLVTNQNIQIK